MDKLREWTKPLNNILGFTVTTNNLTEFAYFLLQNLSITIHSQLLQKSLPFLQTKDITLNYKSRLKQND